jgi:hypothetical protein
MGMFAIFNLGAQELIILAVLAFLLFGGVVLAIVLAMAFVNRRKDGDDSSDV